MRRDDGCGERGAGLADGRQGRETGDTIDADGLRPLHDKTAVGRTDAPGVYEDSVRPSDCELSFRGPGGPPCGGSAAMGCPDKLVLPGRMCRETRIVWLAVMLSEYQPRMLCAALLPGS